MNRQCLKTPAHKHGAIIHSAGAKVRVFLTLLLTLIAMTASAAETPVELQTAADGSKYVCFDKTNDLLLTLDDKVKEFYIYGDEGTSGAYTSIIRNISITVPSGYHLKVTGTVMLQRYDDLTFREHEDGNSFAILRPAYDRSYRDPVVVPQAVSAVSPGSTLYLHLYAYSSPEGEEKYVRLKAQLIDEKTANPVTVAAGIHGGTVTVDKTEAKYGETVTVTTHADKGYYLNSLVVKSGTTTQSVDGCLWYAGQTSATFQMPLIDATVTPEFVTEDRLSVTLPTSGTRTAAFPTGDAAILVAAADGLAIPEEGSFVHLKAFGDEKIQLNLAGYLVLMAGEGVTIYDGATTEAKILYDKQVADGESLQFVEELETMFSSGSDLLVRVKGRGDGYFEGEVMLAATSFKEGGEYKISTTPMEHGTIEVQSSAKAADRVAIKVHPDEGYLLRDLIVTPKAGSPVALSEYTWYDGTNTLSFEMPASAVSIEAVFIPTSDSRSINIALYSLRMPVNGLKTVNLTETAIPQIIVCGDGGPDSDYSDNVNGSLLLTAPKNHRFNLMGMPQLADTGDSVTVYDGATTTSSKIYEWTAGRQQPSEKMSTGNQLLIVFHTNESGHTQTGFGLLLETQQFEGLQGSGTVDDPYLLTSEDDWNAFAQKVNSGEQSDACAELQSNLYLSFQDAANMVGSADHPYAGTFEGNGYEMSVYAQFETADVVAPFAYISGASISDLHVEGTLQGSTESYVGGIAGKAIGNNSSISRCMIGENYIRLSGKTIGGIIGCAKAPLDIEDCLVGRYVALIGSQACGMVGSADTTTSISHSLVTVGFIGGDADSNYVFGGNLANISLNDAYHMGVQNAVPQGIKLTHDDFYPLGKVLSMLQGDRKRSTRWMQDVRRDAMFVPYNKHLLNEEDGKYYMYYAPNRGMYYVGTLDLDTYETEEGFHPATLNPAVDLRTDEVRLANRTFTGTPEAPGLYTLCVPFDVNPADHNIKAYQLASADQENGTVTFSEVDNMVAAEPYLIAVTTDNVTISATDAKVFSKDVEPKTVNGVTMTGNYAYLDGYDLAGQNAYILQDDNLWHPVTSSQNSEVWLSASRAHLTFASPQGAKAFAMKLSDGTATGVSAIKTVDNDGAVSYYDLSGKYVGTSLDGVKRGLYINSKGEKVIK